MRKWITWAGLAALVLLIGFLLLHGGDQRTVAKAERIGDPPNREPALARLELVEPVEAARRDAPRVHPRVTPNLPGLHGRVLESTTERPVRRAIAWAANDEGIFAREFTDRDGRFALPVFGLEEAGPIKVGVTAPRAWKTEEVPIELGPDALGGGEEVVFHVTRLLRAPLRGVVVDVADDRPVPFYRLQVRGPGAIRAYPMTDEQGRFTTEGEFEVGTVHVEPSDAPGFAAIAHPHLLGPRGGGDVVIRVAAGPTYKLHLLLPSEVPRVRFRSTLELADGSGGEVFAAYVDTVREPWVRFSGKPAEHGPWRVSVRVRGKNWTASTLVDARTGLYPETLRLDFRPVGDLWGSVSAADGTPIEGVHVVSSSGRKSEAPRSTRTDADGDYGIDDLPGGRYRVRFTAEGFLDHEASVEIVPGDLATLRVRLVRDQ